MTQQSLKKQVVDVVSCLQNQTITVYINGTSPEWALQKSHFKGLLPEDMVIDCSLSLEAQKSCEDKGVSYFPSWNKDGKLIRGVYTPRQLAVKATCPKT